MSWLDIYFLGIAIAFSTIWLHTIIVEDLEFSPKHISLNLASLASWFAVAAVTWMFFEKRNKKVLR